MVKWPVEGVLIVTPSLITGSGVEIANVDPSGTENMMSPAAPEVLSASIASRSVQVSVAGAIVWIVGGR